MRKITSEKLAGRFGMVEMEEAAAKIINYCNGDWEKPFTYRILDKDNNFEMVGFFELIDCGWIKSFMDIAHLKAHFKVTKKFLNRIKDVIG